MRLLLFALILAAPAAAMAQTPAAPLSADLPTTAPVQLFNGKDLTGWHYFNENAAIAQDAAWKIADGVLQCTGQGRGYLRSVNAYGDYKLHVEWRWPGTGGNSGVMLNSVGPDVIWAKGFEAQLQNGRAGDFASFFDARSKDEIVSRNPRGVSTGRLNRAAGVVEKPLGEWNSYDIVVDGDTIALAINGVPANKMTGVTPSAGHIALQGEGSAIEFRNVVLTPLPTHKDLHAPMPAGQ